MANDITVKNNLDGDEVGGKEVGGEPQLPELARVLCGKARQPGTRLGAVARVRTRANSLGRPETKTPTVSVATATYTTRKNLTGSLPRDQSLPPALTTAKRVPAPPSPEPPL